MMDGGGGGGGEAGQTQSTECEIISNAKCRSSLKNTIMAAGGVLMCHFVFGSHQSKPHFICTESLSPHIIATLIPQH